MLDKSEFKQFCENLLDYINDDRKQNYDGRKMDEYCHEFDSNKNGYFERKELSKFIK